MKQTGLIFASAMAAILAAFPVSAEPPSEENYTSYQHSDAIAVKDIEIGEWRIPDATLVLDRVEKGNFIMAPVRQKDGSMQYQVVNPETSFQIAWMTIQNNSESAISVAPFFRDSLVLIDSNGVSHEIDERMKEIGAFFPNVSAGAERKFFIYFDVPEDTVPAALKIGLLKAIIELEPSGE